MTMKDIMNRMRTCTIAYAIFKKSFGPWGQEDSGTGESDLTEMLSIARIVKRQISLGLEPHVHLEMAENLQGQRQSTLRPALGRWGYL